MSTRGYPRHYLPCLRERLRIGTALASQLPALRDRQTVAKLLCVTRQAITHTEALALWKVAQLLKEHVKTNTKETR